MAFKLLSFFILCNFVLVIGKNTPHPLRQNVTQYLFSDFNGVGDIPSTEKHDDITTLEVSTSTEWKISTETESITVRECQQGQSSISKQDLIVMINYIATTEMNIIATINGSYYDRAILVRDKHMRSLEEFLTKFENRPDHLKHILQDMAQTRLQLIEPVAKEISAKLQDVPKLESSYNEKINDANTVLEKLEKYKKLCDWNCDNQAMEHRSKTKRESKDIYICSTIEELQTSIARNLIDFKTSCIAALNQSITENDKIFDEKVKYIKNEMKEMAVKQFGTNMYDILSLQDEYYHLFEELKNINVASQLSDIKKYNMQIDFKLLELQENIEKYRKHCINCISEPTRIRRYALQIDEDSPTANNISKTENFVTSALLHELIETKINEVKNLIDVDYQTIFEEINDKLNNKNTIDLALAKLKPIQDIMFIDFEAEEKQFESVKDLVPKASLEKVNELNMKSKILTAKLEDALKYISKYNK